MDPILQVEHLSKTYEAFSLEDLSFELEKGYIMGFIGPNGAGKSTTIKLIMNLLHKDAGTIRLFGEDHLVRERAVKERIGFIYDQNHFYDELTIERMKRILASFYPGWDDRAFYLYLKRFGLKPESRIKTLSRGMKMKFSLATALSHQAELIIMDEPTSGLDPVFRSEILDILSEIIEDGNRSVFFSSHITQDLERAADYITFINNGRLVFSREREAILEAFTLVKGPHDLLESVLSLDTLVGFRRDRYGFSALLNEPASLHGLDPERTVIEKPDIDDIMLYTVRGASHA